ncbi:MAG: carboxypeptidase-like regulatory domain-containing protein [Planctomycetota bacterium]
MSPRSRSRLTLLPLLLLVLAAAWVLFPTDDTSDGLDQEGVQAEEVIAAAPAVEAAPPTAPEVGNRIERTEFVDPVIALTENVALGYPPERDILVRAELTLVEGEQKHPPKDCEGWTVVAQTWISETGEIARFEAVSDKKGIAEFHFPDFIHVDWVMCLPPEDSGYAVAFYEGHDDLGPDDDYLALLHMQPAKGAFGLVRDQQGRPVSGAVVHAFDDGWTYGLGDWTPGFLTTETDSQGRFEFPQLSPATWVFAVEPEQWLMINPVLGHQHEYFGLAEIRSDTTERKNVGILTVVPMVSVELTMLGSNGAPAVGAGIYLDPLTLDDWAMEHVADANLTPEQEIEAMFSSQSAEALNDLPYSFYFTSDREGKVKLRLLRGRYNMMVDALPGMMEGEENPHLDFHTDQGQVVYRYQAPLSELHGVVRGNDGSPMYGANVGLNWRSGEEDWDGDDRSCDATGAFLFQSVRIGGEFNVYVWPGSDQWLPLARPLSSSDFGGDLVLELQPAEKLLLDFDLPVLPDRIAAVRILEFYPREGERFDPEAQWWKNRVGNQTNLRRSNRANISALQGGTYKIALYHTAADYRHEEGREAVMHEIGRWDVKTKGAWQTVEVSWP